MTGSIKTNITENSSTPPLPENSKYIPVKKDLDDLRDGVRNYKLSTVDEYASKVVVDILVGATGKVWRGANSSLAYWLSHLLPRRVFVSGCPA